MAEGVEGTETEVVSQASPVVEPVVMVPSAPVGEKKKIKGPVELIKGAWGIFASNWKATSLLILDMFLLFLAVLIVAAFAGFSSGMHSYSVVTWIIGLAALVLLVAGATIIALALHHSVIQAGEGKIETVKESLAYGQANALQFFWVDLMVGLFALIMFALLILPGIWAYTCLTMATSVFVLEGVRGTDTLRRSFALVKGYWWATFGRVFVFILVAEIIAYVLGRIPFVGLLVVFIVAPLTTAYLYLIYKELVAVKA